MGDGDGCVFHVWFRWVEGRALRERQGWRAP